MEKNIKYKAYLIHLNEIKDVISLKFRKNGRLQGYVQMTDNHNSLFHFNGKNKNAELMEYTGFEDQYKSEIYQGHIIAGKSSNIFSNGEEKLYEIIWAIDRWHAKGTTFDNLQQFINYCDLKFKIVGNKFQNSELLKGNKND